MPPKTGRPALFNEEMKQLSVLLPARDIEHIDALARLNQTNRSTIARWCITRCLAMQAFPIADAHELDMLSPVR